MTPESLRQQIGDILRNWDDKGANDFTEELAIDKVLDLLAAQQIALLDRIEKEVIGEDDELLGESLYPTDSRVADEHNSYFRFGNNQKADQRQALSKLREELR